MLHLGLRAAAALLAAISVARCECDREALVTSVDEYITGLTMGWAGTLQNVADGFKNVENNKTMDITSGIMFKGLRIDYNRSIVDMPACATYTEMISHTINPPHDFYVTGFQLRHNASDMSLQMVDVTVARVLANSSSFNVSKALDYVEVESRDVLEPARRSPRATLRAVADAYLDMIGSNRTATDTVPWGTPCDSLQGSRLASCRAAVLGSNGSNSTAAVSESRRYVIDEEVGSVSVLSLLGKVPDSHEFRLEGGKLRYVHQIVGGAADLEFVAGSTPRVNVGD